LKAYCINLDRRPDRLEHMGGQFSHQGISFTRVAAIDALRPDIAAQAANCPPTSLGPQMSAGAFACFLSHREAWRQVIASGDAHAMVLEDDLLLADGIAAYLHDGWVPPDADLVRLETFGTRLHVSDGDGYRVGPRKLRRLRSSHLGAGCYVISARTAHTLFDQSTVFSEPVDRFMFSTASKLFTQLVTYQMIPAPAAQGKRPISGPDDGTWSKSSITARFAAGTPAGIGEPETAPFRLLRRLREELLSHIRGTRYIVVTHG
jgi:glycosyl transferase family 25